MTRDLSLNLQRSASPRRLAVRIRHIVYLQLLALIPSVFYGRCEQWGFSGILLNGILGSFSTPIVVGLAWSALLFPLAVSAFLMRDHPKERWGWVAIPLSIAISFAQFLAIVPLVQ